ncbi:FecR domain-containing protein [Mucilaginibacter sp. cycad4]|uniref:FecR family protein n=1 Tax=Mucilaginibacter sp. cycad4 TaxID=3342096 RepID=UPI002AAAF3A1|nr:FecR domain-containing protein [Mucilaginibacter gossypii]WPU98427.1 FecR domain-containing protein [Mucilaginibacter gossypii]
MNRFDQLLTKYKNDLCTPEELAELLDYFTSDDVESELKLALHRHLSLYGGAADVTEEETETVLDNIRTEIAAQREKKSPAWYWWASAAVVLIFGATVLFRTPEKPQGVARVVRPAKSHITPGSNKAILTLSNGQTVQLTGAPNGKIAQQGGVSVQKLQNGKIIYSADSSSQQQLNAWNQIETPRGGTYDIVLSDGTHIWLNAGSTLSYPVAFTKSERTVKLTGEGYFEVAHNGKPFKVLSNGQTVQVLGTHFNVEAYSDERSIKTTLLEGSVRVNYNGAQALIVPGQMAVNDLSGQLKVRKADTEKIIAWKNGLFIFDDESVAEVMRKAARWYDIEVDYQGITTRKKLWGTVSRYKTINELMDNIAIAGKLTYKIDGRRVILMR